MPMKLLRVACAMIVCGWVGANVSLAQRIDTTRIPYSVFLQGGVTSPVASNIYCLNDAACPPFSSGLGTSLDLVITTRFTLADNLSLTAGLGGGLWTTTMQSTDAAGRTRDAKGNVVAFVREQTLSARSTYISTVASIAYAIGDLRLSLGPRLELGLGAPTWQQTSRIVSPSNVVYPDGSTQIVSVPEQTIPNANAFRISASWLAEYAISLSSTSSIAPYLAVSYSPMSVRSGADWTDVRGALGISFHSIFDYITKEKPKPVVPPQVVDAPVVDRPIAASDGAFDQPSSSPSVAKSTVTPSVLADDVAKTQAVAQADSTTQTFANVKVVAAPTEQPIQQKSSAPPPPVIQDRYSTSEVIDSTTRMVRGASPGSIVIRGNEQRRIDTVLSATERLIITTIRRTDTVEKTIVYTQPKIVLRREGSTSKDLAVRFTTQEQSQTFSVLPFVFFDSASATIPSRYRLPLSINDFDASKAASDQHSMYLEVLNVIGSRMRTGLDTVVVHGYADSSSEAGSCDLARRRAESVKVYLVKTWGIAPQRITIASAQSMCVPEIASPSSNSEGRAENRRVEILTPNYELYLPVVRRDVTVIIDSDLDSLKASVDSPTDPVNKWVTRLRQDEAVIHERQHTSIKNSAAFSVPDHILAKLQSTRPVQLQVIGYTSLGDTLESTTPVRVVLQHEQQRLRTLALAMFEFKRSALTMRDSVLLKEFARNLQLDDRISINGYTDQLGVPSFNDALSKDRAATVADRLRIERSECRITEVIGHGARRFPRGLDSYALPEQRFMCRTVQLEVR